jgi:cation transport ATPase
MAAASAGIAVSGAAEIAIEAADVYLRSPSITAIAATARGAQDTLATIRRNLKFSLAYNLIAGALAVTGLIHPLIAAAVMPLSSLTVLASSLRSRAFRDSIPRAVHSAAPAEPSGSRSPVSLRSTRAESSP